MGKNAANSGKDCASYLANKRRIKNKQAKLDKKLKRIKKEESKTKIIKNSRIGRAKEGFQNEEFKFIKKAKKVVK